MKVVYLFVVLCFLASCEKAREDDPLLSFRKPNARLCQKWKIVRTEIKDGVQLAKKYTEYIEIDKSHEWFRIDSTGKRLFTAGSWNWLEGNSSYRNFECISFQYNYAPLNIEHKLTRLTNAEITSESLHQMLPNIPIFIFHWSRL
jgi:hypothetical protein